jgi:hypothetical protein
MIDDDLPVFNITLLLFVYNVRTSLYTYCGKTTSWYMPCNNLWHTRIKIFNLHVHMKQVQHIICQSVHVHATYVYRAYRLRAWAIKIKIHCTCTCTCLFVHRAAPRLSTHTTDTKAIWNEKKNQTNKKKQQQTAHYMYRAAHKKQFHSSIHYSVAQYNSRTGLIHAIHVWTYNVLNKI